MEVFNKSTGVFGLPFVDKYKKYTTDLNKTNRWFSNLKNTIKSHISTKAHTTVDEHSPARPQPNYRGSDRGFALWSTLFKLQNIFKNYQYLK